MIETLEASWLRKPVIVVGVHDGDFHADDVLALSLLRVVYWGYEFKIIRTRDVAALETCDLLIDVGGRFDGSKYFDHHQDRTLKCSVSLLWDVIAAKYPFHYDYINDTVLDAVSELDTDFSVAESKRGPYTNYYTITALIGDMNYLDGGFNAALQIGEYFWRANLAKCDVLLKEREYIENGSQTGNVLWVEKGMDIKNHLKLLNSMGVRYVWHPHYNPNKYCLKTISSKQYPLPLDIEGADFIHATRFLAIFPNLETTLEAIKLLV